MTTKALDRLFDGDIISVAIADATKAELGFDSMRAMSATLMTMAADRGVAIRIEYDEFRRETIITRIDRDHRPTEPQPDPGQRRRYDLAPMDGGGQPRRLRGRIGTPDL